MCQDLLLWNKMPPRDFLRQIQAQQEKLDFHLPPEFAEYYRDDESKYFDTHGHMTDGDGNSLNPYSGKALSRRPSDISIGDESLPESRKARVLHERERIVDIVETLGDGVKSLKLHHYANPKSEIGKANYRKIPRIAKV